MSTGNAKEIAREAVKNFDSVEFGASSLDLEVAVAEYAVNLALTESCKAVCKHCEYGMPVYLCNITKSWRHREGCTGGNDFSCRAAAIRAMMEPK